MRPSQNRKGGGSGGSQAIPVIAELLVMVCVATSLLIDDGILRTLGLLVAAGLFAVARPGWLRLRPAIALAAAEELPNSVSTVQSPSGQTPDIPPVANRKADASDALREIGVAVAEGLPVDALLVRVHMALHRLLDFDSLAVIFYDSKGEQRSTRLYKEHPECLPDNVSVPDGWSPLIERVLNTAKPVRLGDEQCESREPAGNATISGSWLGIPIVVEGEAIGAVVVDHARPRAFDSSDQALLEAIAGPVAVAVRHADLKRERFRRVEQLASLGQISEMIASEQDLDKTLTAIMEQVNRVFNVEAGSLLLVEGDRLEFRVAVGAKAEEVKPFSLQLGQGIAGWVAKNGQPLLVRDVKSDSRHFGDIDQETEFATRSVLCVPMERKGRVVGVIEIINPLDGRLFNDDDLRLLENVANSAVIAIENALLHAQTERRLAEVLTLYTLAKQVTSSLDLNTVLDSVVRILKEVFSCRASCIFLLDERSNQLEIRAAYGVSKDWVRDARLSVGEGVAGRVAAEGTPMYIRDARRYPGFVFFDPAVRSLLVVPLVIKGRVVGTLCVDDKKPDAFSSGDERFLTIAAAQAAVAIENARLYQGLKERAERLERAYEELKEVNRLKTELVQNVSHELRTPLTFIKGYVELLLDNAMGELNKAQIDALRVVGNRTESVIRLVSDIITLQKTELGHFAFAPVSIKDILSQAAEGARVASERAGIRIQVEAPDDLPQVLADRGRVLQVLDNLLANAIKFSPNGGTVTVTAETDDQRVLIVVEDQGVGIAEDKLGKIFERFYQVDGSTTRRFGGAGLGLAIVKQIVEAHGGRVWVKSQVGKGTSFFFTLPAVSQQQLSRMIGTQPVDGET